MQLFIHDIAGTTNPQPIFKVYASSNTQFFKAEKTGIIFSALNSPFSTEEVHDP